MRAGVLVVFALALALGATCWAIPPQEYFCPECQEAAALVLATVASNATDAQIAAAVTKVCDVLPGALKGDCLAEVSTLVLALNTSDTAIAVKYPPRAICAILAVCSVDCCNLPFTPEQIKLALTQEPAEMQVSWTTLNPSPQPTAMWGSAPGVYTANASGTSATYTSGGWIGWVHTVVMTGLAPNTRYYYRVGDPTVSTFWTEPNWSLVPELNFVTGPADSVAQYPLAIAHVGDFGASDAADRTMARIAARVAANTVDLVLQSGDIAYSDGYEALEDQFGRKIELVSAYVPYMTAPGNHEGYYAFAGYKTRFPMPWRGVSDSPLYYAVTYGRVRLVAICTEGTRDGLLAFDLLPGGTQHAWLAAELAAAAASPAIDWIVVFGHRPMYCSSSATECTDDGDFFRAAIEALLIEFSVDLVVLAHRHNYERTYPVANGTVTSSSYANASAPVYIVNGVAGSKQGLVGFIEPPPAWSAVRMATYGYALLTVNASVLEWQYFAAASDELLDSFAITK